MDNKKKLSIMKRVFNNYCKTACNCIRDDNNFHSRNWHIQHLEGVADGICSIAIWCTDEDERFKGSIEFKSYTKKQIKKLEIKWACYSNYKKY